MKLISELDIDHFARTIWAEARGEGATGMEACAWAIRNRVYDEHGRWPSTYSEVCRQRLQFSCWNDNDPNRAPMIKVDNRDTAFLTAQAIALDVITVRIRDSSNGANHYLTHDLFRSRHRPNWADPERITARIGNHVFLHL
ncbi:MAG: cell wall hydrolase [Geminicoccaceae bacterium]